MTATPVVDRDAPPADSHLVIRALREDQLATVLRRTHQPSRPIATLNGSGVGDVVPKLFQGLFDALARTMATDDFDRLQLLPGPMLDDLRPTRQHWSAIAQ